MRAKQAYDVLKHELFQEHVGSYTAIRSSAMATCTCMLGTLGLRFLLTILPYTYVGLKQQGEI